MGSLSHGLVSHHRGLLLNVLPSKDKFKILGKYPESCTIILGQHPEKLKFWFIPMALASLSTLCCRSIYRYRAENFNDNS